MKQYSVAILICSIGTAACAVQLENWRAPFYRIAADEHEISGSPSGMFWDDLGTAGIFDSTLWPDSSRYGSNHWTLEPAITATVSNEPFVTGKKNALHLDALSNFRWHRLTVRTALDVDQNYTSDPDFVWKKDRVAAGLIEEAYLQYTGNYGFARLGRLKRNWGPFINRSILLSNNPFAYDAFEWQFHTPFLEFRHLFSAFPRQYSYTDTRVYDANLKLDRYFAAHSLNFIFGSWGSLGISETVLFSRNNGFPDLHYINPFSLYSVLNTNGEGQANLMLGFQGWFHPVTDKITCKGQVVFDDFQVDNETEGDKEPTHWAGDFGCYWSDLLPLALKHHISVEYRYMSKWIYTVSDPNTFSGERYTYVGRSLGYPDIDGDAFTAGFTLVGRNYWAGSAGFTVVRQDTITIDSLWHSNAALGYRNETRLSQRAHLKTTLNPFISLHGYFKNIGDAHLSFESRWVQDKKRSNAYTFDPFISLVFSIHYADLFVRFNDR